MDDRLARLLQRVRPLGPDPAVEGDRRWAAVALILVPDPDALLLIRRAERAGDPWSGHMALPGGRREASDPDLAATAIRETAEEVGIVLRRGELVGMLDDVVPRTPTLPPIGVRPFVFLLSGPRPQLALNPEVASAAWVELETLQRPDTYSTVTVHLHGADREVQAYRVQEALVWGMTERILTGFLPTPHRS